MAGIAIFSFFLRCCELVAGFPFGGDLVGDCLPPLFGRPRFFFLAAFESFFLVTGRDCAAEESPLLLRWMDVVGLVFFRWRRVFFFPMKGYVFLSLLRHLRGFFFSEG